MKKDKLEKSLKTRMRKDSGYLISAHLKLYKEVIKRMAEPFIGKRVDKIMAPEMKGMLYGPTISHILNIPFVSIIKAGRIPKRSVVSKSFRDYSKKEKTIHIAKRTIKEGERILVVDDVFDSGESGRAIISLIKKLGGKVAGISIVYNKLNKKDEKFFKRYNLHYLVKLKKC